MLFRAFAVAVAALCLANPCLAITRSWTGAASALWSDPANWSPAAVPAPEDSLVFPVGVARTSMTNDLPANTAVGPMHFASSYTLSGNALTLTGNLTFDQGTYPNFVCMVPLRLGANVRLGAAITSEYWGAIDVNGHALAIDSYNTRLAAPVNGSGTITIHGSGITIEQGGAFSGAIVGSVNVAGSIPDASFTGVLTGSGTVGAVNNAGGLSPGAKNPAYTSDPHSIGTLNTKSLALNATFSVDLIPGGTSDEVRVTGSVTLGGQPLWVTVPAGSVGAGQSFTIIDNDGSDAVSGTFLGLAEGASIAVPGGSLTISYRGGDGNDVVLSTAHATKTWTGAVNALWSNAGNWSPASIPAAGEPLIFPAGVARNVMTNDLPAGTAVGAMDFRADYTLNGNALTLTGDLTFDQSTYTNFVCNVTLVLGAPVRLGTAITSDYNGAIDVNGHTLTIDSYNTALRALRGSGAIVVTGSGVSILESGTFDGTITGTVELLGALPNADLTGGLSGSGTVGTVNAVGAFYPGSKNPAYTSDPHTIGTFHTQSLSIAGPFHVDLVPGAASDHVLVTGGVTLSGNTFGGDTPGNTLAVTVASGGIASGQTFVLIDNDGTDAVNGTFDGLPEGTQISFPGGSAVTISYRGGDGNDVVLTAVSALKTWTGANGDLWSTPGNWSPAGVPASGEPLVFPAGPHTSMTNDLPAGTAVGPLHFGAAGYTLNGNALTLTGKLTFDWNTRFTTTVPLTLGASVRLGAAITSDYHGAIDVNGHTLTIESYNTTLHGTLDGSGAVVVEGAGISIRSGGAFSGTITGSVDVAGSLPNANMHGLLTGDGTVGAVTADSLSAGSKNPAVTSDPHTIGTLRTQSLAIDGPLFVDVTGSGASDRLDVTGAVTLGGGELHVSVPTGSPAAGQTFTIIDNDGADAVAGTFDRYLEQALIDLAPWMFRISYAGGDGNDVVLTAIERTEVTPEQLAEITRYGEEARISARVTARNGVPTGSVTFTDNNDVVSVVPLVNGTAVLDVALDPGEHSIGAVYEGTQLFAPSFTAIRHLVLRGNTTSSVTVPKTLVYGDPVQLAVGVQPVAPAEGVPTGAVILAANGAPLGSAALNGGTATIASGVLDAGTYTIAADYEGDSHFEPSSSMASVTVQKAPTVTDATASNGTLTVQVTAAQRPALAVTGMVTVSENGAVLAQQPVAGGAVAVALDALPSGDHHLTISFAGSSNFEPSSATVVYSVGPPQAFVRNVAVLETDAEQSVTLSVELTAITTETVSLGWATADGTANAGADYRAASGSLVFGPGETVKTITLQIAGDDTAEADETFAVRLTSALGEAAGTVTIVNDDLTYRAAYGLVYANAATGPLTLDLYTPSEGNGPFPLIVWVPGADAYDAEGPVPPALRETSRGYAVAVVRYRPVHVARFPAQLDDLRNAVRWLRANAGQWQLDTDHIAAWGASAGAHLASLLGTMNDGSVQAVVAWGGASDLLRLQSDGASGACRTSYDDRTSPQSQLLGCALPSCMQSASAASPLSHVSADDPAFLIMHGDDDCVVPFAQSTRLYDALRAAGVVATLHRIDGGAPSTWTAPRGMAEVEAFLDAQLKRGPMKRRAVR